MEQSGSEPVDGFIRFTYKEPGKPELESTIRILLGAPRKLANVTIDIAVTGLKKAIEGFTTE